MAMKRIMSALGCVACLTATAVAQEERAGPVANPPVTNSVAVSKTNAVSSTNAVSNTNAPTAPGDAEKPDIKELIKLPAFTNSIGMFMVKISDSLWAGKYEVTQEEYRKVAGSNPSQFQGDRNPVDSVSWNAAMSFCQKLTDIELKEEMLPEGFAYKLPTQAQWESLAAGADLKDAVTSASSSRSGPSTVGSLGATGAGLHDIRGNVWEWCLDPQDKPFRVARGAGWDTFFEVNLRPEFRWYGGPDEGKNMVGFRCLLVPAAD